MKQKIRLTESDIRKIVKESVRGILNESSWCGVPGTTFIWHGEWSEPEVEYKGVVMNLNDVEEFVAISNDLPRFKSEHAHEVKSMAAPQPQNHTVKIRINSASPLCASSKNSNIPEGKRIFILVLFGGKTQ